MKMFFGVNVGPIGYYFKQVTNDANYGGPTVFAGLANPPGEQLGFGGTMSTQFGKLSIQFMLMGEVYARNAVQGTKGWLNFSYRFN